MKSVAVRDEARRPSVLGRRAAWAAVIMLSLVAVALAVIPLRLIHPFRPQTPGGMEVAYTIWRWSPLVTLIGAIVTVALAVYLWRGRSRWWAKMLLVIFVALSIGTAWFARQNVFEWMFAPQPGALYVRALEADFVADSDRVMAVEVDGEAVAYPVRQLAYHHVVEDTVGGRPLVATY